MWRPGRTVLRMLVGVLLPIALASGALPDKLTAALDPASRCEGITTENQLDDALGSWKTYRPWTPPCKTILIEGEMIITRPRLLTHPVTLVGSGPDGAIIRAGRANVRFLDTKASIVLDNLRFSNFSGLGVVQVLGSSKPADKTIATVKRCSFVDNAGDPSTGGGAIGTGPGVALSLIHI